MSHGKIFNAILLRARSQSEKTTYDYDSNYMKFWNRQNYGDSKKRSGVAGGLSRRKEG